MLNKLYAQVDIDTMLSGCSITPLRIPYKAPNANSHAENF